MRRKGLVLVLGLLLGLTVACTNKKAANPLANVGSKQPDKVLFDRAMDAMKHNHFDVARMTLQTLINTYPDSEYIARAKLGVADSWYAEGGTTAMQQAEIEYKDFRTFFPNMPEAAEAQLKVANIHYEEMEKPDRDFTHAVRAEEEYRSLIMDYPDSKLVPVAKQRLREVQEVLAQREFDIGHFYYMRMAYPAAIARLKTLVDRYPLYSGADEALYLVGQSYEAEINVVRKNVRIGEVGKAKMIDELTKEAAQSYAEIITRYPAMDRAVDAKDRLEAMHQPVPRPTKAALEQNKREIASRVQEGTLASMLGDLEKHPDVAKASRVGEPSLVDPEPVTATKVVQQMTGAAMGDGNKVSAVMVNGKPMQGEEAPRSDAAPAATATADSGTAATASSGSSDQSSVHGPAAVGVSQSTVADPNELKPNVEQDPTALPPLQQNNEIGGGGTPGSASAATPPKTEEMGDISSSKKKKKKGLKKLDPF